MITDKVLREKMKFFLTFVGFGYDPRKETARQGRWNCALALSNAESRLIDSGAIVAHWEIDPDITSHDWEDSSEPERHTYLLYMESSKTGEVLASLGGIDFGDGDPFGNSDKHSNALRRLYPAELAVEIIQNEDSKDTVMHEVHSCACAIDLLSNTSDLESIASKALVLDHTELSTVLVALRLYQSLGYSDPTELNQDIYDIATDGGSIKRWLTNAQIDELCQRINQ